MKVLSINKKKYSAKKHSVKKGLAKSKQSGGADFDKQLRESAKNGDLEKVKRLIQQDANINSRDKRYKRIYNYWK